MINTARTADTARGSQDHWTSMIAGREFEGPVAAGAALPWPTVRLSSQSKLAVQSDSSELQKGPIGTDWDRLGRMRSTVRAAIWPAIVAFINGRHMNDSAELCHDPIVHPGGRLSHTRAGEPGPRLQDSWRRGALRVAMRTLLPSVVHLPHVPQKSWGIHSPYNLSAASQQTQDGSSAQFRPTSPTLARRRIQLRAYAHTARNPIEPGLAMADDFEAPVPNIFYINKVKHIQCPHPGCGKVVKKMWNYYSHARTSTSPSARVSRSTSSQKRI